MVGTTANSISVNWPSKFLSFSGKTSTTSPVKFHQGPSGNGEPVTRFHLRCREVKRSEEFSTQTEETSNFSYFFIFQMLLLFFFSTFFFFAALQHLKFVGQVRVLRGWLNGMPASPEDSDPMAGCPSDFGSSVIESVKGSLKKARSVTEARLRIPVYAISGAG